jgi:membrane protease YdiL (CAAX protease family)
MNQKSKEKLRYLIAFAIAYILLNFIPFKFFMEELPYLIFRLASYLLLMALALVFKYKREIEIPVPPKTLSHLLILPFVIPCFADIFYAVIFEAEFNVSFNWMVLSLETVIDLFDSIVEDVVFVDVMISFLLDYMKDDEKHNLHAMLISSAIFTLIRTYVFIYYDFDDAIFNLVVTFLITFGCGYLAIYYASEWIPIVFHFLFNVPNFVIAPILFNYETELEYYLFISIFIVPLFCYTLFMYFMSERRLHRHSKEKLR